MLISIWNQHGKAKYKSLFPCFYPFLTFTSKLYLSLMRPDNLIGNIIWLIFGGFIAALGYFIGGLLLCITVIGIPFGMQCFKIGGFVLAPFGYQAVSGSSSSGCLSLLFNIVWIFCGGFAAAVSHLVFGVILCITVIGIPFGLQHFKLIEVSLMPFGKRIVTR